MPHDDMLERSQSLLLRSATSRRHLTDFFSRALSAFQSSSDSAQKLQVVCTAPPSASSSHASPASAAAHEAQGGKPCYPPHPAPIPPTKRPHTLIVLDSSFNPPTLAHLRMATSAVQDIIRKKRKGGDENDMTGLRLLLLLAVVNADKAPKPAAFDQRLAMMWAFAHDLQRALRGEESEAEDESPDEVMSKKPQIHDSSQLEAAEEQQKQTRQQKQGLVVDISVDIGLTSKPFFHEKSRVIAESEFYKPPPGGQEEEDTMEQVILVGFDTLVRIFDPKYYGPPPPPPPPTSATPVTQVTPVHGTSRGGAPIQQALDPLFKRAKLRVTLRTDDEWGGKQEQMAYLESLLSEEELAKIGGSKQWADRIELVEGRRDGEEIVSSTYARKAAEREEWEKLRRLVSPEVEKWIEGERLYVVDVKPGGC